MSTYADLETALRRRTEEPRVVHVARPAVTDGVRRARLLAGTVPLLDAVALLAVVELAGTGALGLLYAAIAIAFLAMSGAYRMSISPTLARAMAPIITGMTLPLVVIGPLWAGNDDLAPLLRAVPFAVVAVVLARAASHAIVRSARSRGFLRESTLILGAGQLGGLVADTLEHHPEYGLVPIGFIDNFDDHSLALPMLGTVADLEQRLSELHPRRVIVSFGAVRESELVPVLRACDRHHVEVHIIPRFFELGVAPAGLDVDYLWGIPLIRLRRSALRTRAWRTKRMFDVVVAGTALTLAGPIFLAAALAVRLTSPGPVLFRQRRVGQNGKTVEILKFRTLQVNDDSDTNWSDTADRTTPVGGLLRATSLDELPQLLNVLRGDMSLVGPRPERPHFVDRFNEEVRGYNDRHRVPVGMTGWAQIHGLRGDTSISERARFDNYYIENWSLWLDVVSLCRTTWEVARTVVRGRRTPR